MVRKVKFYWWQSYKIWEISDIYDCKYQNISKKRNKLVKKLADELFPEDVLKEILQKQKGFCLMI